MNNPKYRTAPSDTECDAAWTEIMRIAGDHCLVVQAYGGVATLALPCEQRQATVRERVLRACLAKESLA